MEHLQNKLINDISKIGLPVDFTLQVKNKYCQSFLGRYYPKQRRIVVYALDYNRKEFKYSELLAVTIHEAIHHYQYQHQEGFVRKRGIMHNPSFKVLLKKYLKIAEEEGLIS